MGAGRAWAARGSMVGGPGIAVGRWAGTCAEGEGTCAVARGGVAVSGACAMGRCGGCDQGESGEVCTPDRSGSAVLGMPELGSAEPGAGESGAAGPDVGIPDTGAAAPDTG